MMINDLCVLYECNAAGRMLARTRARREIPDRGRPPQVHSRITVLVS